MAATWLSSNTAHQLFKLVLTEKGKAAVGQQAKQLLDSRQSGCWTAGKAAVGQQAKQLLDSRHKRQSSCWKAGLRGKAALNSVHDLQNSRV